jgi:hypothetical protein
MSTENMEEETRKLCLEILEVMKKAKQEAEMGKGKAENSAQKVAQYCAELKSTYFSLGNRLTNWSTTYRQWWSDLPIFAKWHTYNLFWHLLYCLTYAAYATACSLAATVGYETGRFSDLLNPASVSSAKALIKRIMEQGALAIQIYTRHVQNTARDELPTHLYEYLDDIGKVFGTMKMMEMNFSVKKESTLISCRAQPLYQEWSEAMPYRQATKDLAATALESIIFTLSEFKKVMDIACDYNMRHDISNQLICFLNTADILRLVRKFAKTFPVSQLSVVFRLVDELVATLVSEKDKETMNEIFNEMALHVISFFSYFWDRKDEDGWYLADELSERIDGTPTQNPVAYVISGLIYGLVEIIAISRNTFLVSEAQATMDNLFKMMIARIVALKDTNALSAKMKKLAKKWMDITKKRSLTIDTPQTVNGAIVKTTVKVRFETEKVEAGWTVKVPIPYLALANLNFIDKAASTVKVTVKMEMRRVCLEKMKWAESEAANYTLLAGYSTQAVANCASQLRSIYLKNQQPLTDWGKYDSWRGDLPTIVREQIDELSRAVDYTLAYAMAAFAFAYTVKVWARVVRISYWMNHEIVSSAIHEAESMCKEASIQADYAQNMGNMPKCCSLMEHLMEQLQQREKDFTLIQSIFGNVKANVTSSSDVTSSSEMKDFQRTLPTEAAAYKQIAKTHAIQAVEATLRALIQFQGMMDVTCNNSVRCHISCHINTFLINASIWKLASGNFVKDDPNSCLSVIPRLVSGLVKAFCRRATASPYVSKNDKTTDKVIDQITLYVICHFVYFCSLNDHNGDRLKLLRELSTLLCNSPDDLTKDADADVVCKSVCSLVQAIAIAKNAFFVVEARKAMDEIIEAIAEYVEPLKNNTLSGKVAGLMKKWREATCILTVSHSG